MTYEKTFVPQSNNRFGHAGITYYNIFVFGVFQNQYGKKSFIPYPYLKSAPYSTNVYDTWPTDPTDLDSINQRYSGIPSTWYPPDQRLICDETTTTMYLFHNCPHGVAIPFPENTEFCMLDGFCVYRDAPDPYVVYSTDNMETNEDQVLSFWDITRGPTTCIEVPRGNLIERRKFGFFVPGKHWNALVPCSQVFDEWIRLSVGPTTVYCYPPEYKFTRMRVCVRLYADGKEVVMYQELTRIYNDTYPATIVDYRGITVPNPLGLWFGQYEAPYEPSGVYHNFDYYYGYYTDPKYCEGYYYEPYAWTEYYLAGATEVRDFDKIGTWINESTLFTYFKASSWFHFSDPYVTFELGLLGHQPLTAKPILGEDDVIDGAN